jgi:hypothetical protein
VNIVSRYVVILEMGTLNDATVIVNNQTVLRWWHPHIFPQRRNPGTVSHHRAIRPDTTNNSSSHQMLFGGIRRFPFFA